MVNKLPNFLFLKILVAAKYFTVLNILFWPSNFVLKHNQFMIDLTWGGLDYEKFETGFRNYYDWH